MSCVGHNYKNTYIHQAKVKTAYAKNIYSENSNEATGANANYFYYTAAPASAKKITKHTVHNLSAVKGHGGQKIYCSNCGVRCKKFKIFCLKSQYCEQKTH